MTQRHKGKENSHEPAQAQRRRYLWRESIATTEQQIDRGDNGQCCHCAVEQHKVWILV